MNYLFTVLMLLLSPLLWCQSGASTTEKAVGANKVRMAVAEGNLSPQVQANIWQEKAAAQPANAEAWLNYFLWNGRTKKGQEKTSPMVILTQAQEYIGGSPQYFLMQYLASDHRDSTALFYAFNNATDKSWLYPYMIQYCILSGHRRYLHSYCASWDSSENMSKILYQYNFNVLMSADSNATIYARGLNDLVPMVVLQQIYQVRTDIHLQYYSGGVSGAINAYLALSLGKEVLAQYPLASCTGLLVKLFTENGFGEMKRHWENDIRLEELAQAEHLPPGDAQLFRNYLPPMVLMYRYYQKSDASKAASIKDLMEKIGAAAGLPTDKMLEDK